MKAGAFLVAAERLPFAGVVDIVGQGGLVVVAPHPDDESLGCGGLIVEARLQGIEVRVIFVTDGAGSHPNSRRYPTQRLREVRESEALDAADALGLRRDAITFLRLPDRGVPRDGPVAAMALDAIVAAARDCNATAVCVTWEHDPHCDHAAAARLAAQAHPRLGGAHLIQYPIWGWTLPPDTEVGAPPRGWRLDVSAHRVAKAAAIAAHVSQTTDLIDDDPDGFRLTQEMIERFARGPEIYLDLLPRGQA